MDLHTASREGDATAVAQLLAQGCDVNTRDKLLRTPLHLAAWAGHAEVVKLLVAHGGDPKACAMDDMNPLHFAAQKGHADACRWIINAGVPVNSRTRKGITSLHFAAQHGHQAAVELLLARHANPTARTPKDQTPAQLTRDPALRALLHQREHAWLAQQETAGAGTQRKAAPKQHKQGPAPQQQDAHPGQQPTGTGKEDNDDSQQQEGELLIGPVGPPPRPGNAAEPFGEGGGGSGAGEPQPGVGGGGRQESAGPAAQGDSGEHKRGAEQAFGQDSEGGEAVGPALKRAAGEVEVEEPRSGAEPGGAADVGPDGH